MSSAGIDRRAASARSIGDTRNSGRGLDIVTLGLHSARHPQAFPPRETSFAGPQSDRGPARLSLEAARMLPQARPVLLAVFDDGERSALLKTTLDDRGWNVVRAHSCQQARHCAAEQSFDALLTDLVLVDGSAFGLLKAMRQRLRVSAVLTWGNQHGIRERILVSRFDLHLTRPITAEEIDGALRERLRITA